MKNTIFLFVFAFLLISCKEEAPNNYFKKYDETVELAEQQNQANRRLKFKLIQSKYLDMNAVFAPFNNELEKFTEVDYNALKPLIIEQSIPTLQAHVKNGSLSYEKLTLFYLYRIRKFESDSTKSLNSIIALNPNIIEEARKKDKEKGANSEHSIYGMPILLKDNVNTSNMPTTAGAVAMVENSHTNDAFIVEKLKSQGALILGKVNLSEWAYFFCSGCPLGYSAIGGQTLNPYGRKIFETGGSSSGSGVVVAVNFAVAAVGTETSGSITSPSSLNSVVGLKPTIGLLSRTGIVPISNTLDTPGPMTKNVIDTYILLNAMIGYDERDEKSVEKEIIKNTLNGSLKGKRFGVIASLLRDSIYQLTIQKIKNAGAEIVEISPKNAQLTGFTTLLNIDMKYGLPKYLYNYADTTIKVKSVKDIVDFNMNDIGKRAPYGQQLFDGIVKDSTTVTALSTIKYNLKANATAYFEVMNSKNLDAILSINNFHSGVAAVAEFPTLTVPMGYKKSGEPISLTFIGKPFSEASLLQNGAAFEELTKVRVLPKNYE